MARSDSAVVRTVSTTGFGHIAACTPPRNRHGHRNTGGRSPPPPEIPMGGFSAPAGHIAEGDIGIGDRHGILGLGSQNHFPLLAGHQILFCSGFPDVGGSNEVQNVDAVFCPDDGVIPGIPGFIKAPCIDGLYHLPLFHLTVSAAVGRGSQIRGVPIGQIRESAIGSGPAVTITIAQQLVRPIQSFLPQDFIALIPLR